MKLNTARRVAWLLIGGDVLALLLFVAVGQVDHETLDSGNPLGGVLAAAVPFLLCWLVAAALLGAYRTDESALTLRAQFTRTLLVWLVAAPLAILLRALLLGRADIPTAFMIAALSFGGLVLISWRIIFAAARQLYRRRAQVGGRI